MDKKYWQLELPKISIIGKVRFAHYQKGGVLQVNLLHQENDGTINIGKTIAIYKESLCRENIKSLDLVIETLIQWRKETRAQYPSDKHFNSVKQTIVLPGTETLENVLEVGQGDFIYDGLMTESARVETLADIVMNSDAEAMGADAPDADAGTSKNEVSI